MGISFLAIALIIGLAFICLAVVGGGVLFAAMSGSKSGSRSHIPGDGRQHFTDAPNSRDDGIDPALGVMGGIVMADMITNDHNASPEPAESVQPDMPDVTPEVASNDFFDAGGIDAGSDFDAGGSDFDAGGDF